MIHSQGVEVFVPLKDYCCRQIIWKELAFTQKWIVKYCKMTGWLTCFCCVVSCCDVLNCVLWCIELCCDVLSCGVLWWVECYVVLCYVVSCCYVLSCGLLWWVVLYCVVVYCVVMRCVMFHHGANTLRKLHGFTKVPFVRKIVEIIVSFNQCCKIILSDCVCLFPVIV